MEAVGGGEMEPVGDGDDRGLSCEELALLCGLSTNVF